jgi:hypothetical protein
MWHIAEWASVFMGDIYPYMLGSGATDLHRTGTLGLAKVNAIDDGFPFLLPNPLNIHARPRGRLPTRFHLTYLPAKQPRRGYLPPRLGLGLPINRTGAASG